MLSRVEAARAVLFAHYTGHFAKAFRAIEDRERILQNIPHEMRLPISIIRDSLDVLRREGAHRPSPVQAEAIEDIRLANELNRVLVGNILEAATPGEIQTIGEEQVIRLKRDVLEPVLHLLKYGFEAFNIDTGSVEISQAVELPEFKADRIQAMQIFYNLLSNAGKYHASPAAAFRVEVRVQGDRYQGWWVRVRDWGIGVPRHWEELIFQRGRRAPNVEARKDAGLGLGLTVVKKIIGDWGGKVVLTRNQNPTEFSLFLPAELFKW